MSDEEINGNAILANMIKAAVMDAVTDRKMCQLKMAAFTNAGPKFARVIVVPEEMERNFPVNASLGSTSKTEGQ